eukprot:TRINITY_DN20299_c0_g1_i1.p1 TRINITY_DN20299_c0_g1~~TRINITY_DN20299_c0_g1_i1.p1  ORF type:complete len:127 (+),score=28.84 TRINITY_DN20299_c0_g1_i1:19-399(+)
MSIEEIEKRLLHHIQPSNEGFGQPNELLYDPYSIGFLFILLAVGPIILFIYWLRGGHLIPTDEDKVKYLKKLPREERDRFLEAYDAEEVMRLKSKMKDLYEDEFEDDNVMIDEDEDEVHDQIRQRK